MRHDDPRADNLFCRLFSYSPRAGRNPLEDYCTEALVWCLRNAAAFRREFLLQLQIPGLSDRADGLIFETQFNYRQEIDAEEHGGEQYQSLNAGRFDILILAGDSSFAVVVEVKVDADFHHNQLKNYRQELDHSNSFKTVPEDRRFVATITKLSAKPDLSDVNVTWSKIQELLAMTDIEGDARSVCRSFAEFLKEKGMYPVKIRKLTPEDTNNWASCFKYQNQLWHILDEVRKDDKIKPLLRKGGQIICEKGEPDADLYFGIWGTGAPYWLGFEFKEENNSPKLIMRIEASFDRPSAGWRNLAGKTLMELEKMKQCMEIPRAIGTYLIFRQPVDGEFDGEARKMCDWFFQTATELDELHKRLAGSPTSPVSV